RERPCRGRSGERMTTGGRPSRRSFSSRPGALWSPAPSGTTRFSCRPCFLHYLAIPAALPGGGHGVELLEFVGPRLRTDQGRIGGVHHDEILAAETGDEV